MISCNPRREETIFCGNRYEKRSGKKFPGRFCGNYEENEKTEKISICGKKSYFYINVRPLVHNNSEQPTDGGWTQRRTNNMRATGIVRRIDDLGRVVIPKEIRRTLRIREGDPSQIILSEYERFGFAMLRLEERWLGR